MRCPLIKPASAVRQLAAGRQVGRQARGAAATAAAATMPYYTGKDISPPAKGHHFLHIDDFSREQLRA